MQLALETQVTKVNAAAATGTTAVNSSVVDMANFDGVMFVGGFGSTATDISVKVQQSDASDMTGAEDLEGTSLSLDGTAKTFVVDVRRPQKRYLRVVITRTTTTTVEAVFAIQYGPRVVPIDNGAASDIVAESHVSPDAGTA